MEHVKRVLETKIFAVLAVFPVTALGAIYFFGPILAQKLFLSTSTPDAAWGNMAMELVVAFGIGILFVFLSLVPSAIVTIMGLVHTIVLIRRGENSIVFMLLTLIAAVPLLIVLHSYMFG